MRFRLLTGVGRKVLTTGPLLLLLLSTACSPASAKVGAGGPAIAAGSAILMDVGTGRVLWERNADLKRPPASTTKIMTAIIVLENAELDERTIVSPRAEAATSESSIWLKAGEELSVDELMRALLIKSANDAGIALAEHVGGSVESFVALMNRRAAELGAENTHFVNPHGLHHPQHLTTARDLAVMTRHALRFRRFNELVRTRRDTIDWPGKKWDRTLITRNSLLGRFPGADGVKTGYTSQSGRCLVSTSTRDGWRLLGVVLGSPDAVADSKTLLEYGFRNYAPQYAARKNRVYAEVAVRGGVKPKVSLVADRDLYVIAPRGARMSLRQELKLNKPGAPVRKGEKCGYVILFNGDKRVGRAELLAAAPVAKRWLFKLWDFLKTTILAAFILMIGVRVYAGRTPAKIARKGRHRITPGQRETDQGWSRYRKRPPGRDWR